MYLRSFVNVVPLITVYSLGEANYLPKINAILAIDAYNNTPFYNAFIPTYPPFFCDAFAIIAFSR